MTQGGDVPAYWGGKFGDVTLARDTTTFKVKPASLRVSVAGGKSGSGFQTIIGGANGKFKLTGWFKSAGNVKAQVMVQAFADGYKQNQFVQVLYLQGDTDWTSFEKEITLPPWTAFFNVGVLAEGEGSAWLDEVHEVGKPVDAGSPDDALGTGPPAKDKPNVPGWGIFPQFPQAWLNLHKSFLERTKQGNINVVFLGDSITMGWNDTGRPIWDKRYAPLGAVNYGIGGDTTRQVLWRIGHGELDGLQPKLIVMKIGTNNLYGDFNAGSDEEIANGITTIVTMLRKKLPATKILLLGILPRQNEYFSNRVAHINPIIAKLDDSKNVGFLDMGAKFVDAPGRVKANLYNADQLHLSPEGYQVWADTMQPLFNAMLGKSAASLPKLNGEHWIALPMRSEAQLAAGITPGGEGCQYPQTIAIDALKGELILFGTDVGGIYRSTNGGKSFSPCDMGYYAIGSCGFAIDPKNPDHCLSIGDNSGGDYYEYDGVYLSTDRGASWKQTLPQQNRGSEKAREQVAFDPACYDAKLGYCTVAYWAEEGNKKEPGGRLYKTTDGGQSWSEVANGMAYGGGKLSTQLKIAPKSGAVYLANDSGFYKSVDGGVTFTRTLEANLTSLDVCASQPALAIVSTETALMRSEDGGETFAPIQSAGISAFAHVHISPADPNRLLAQNPQGGERFYSNDGGKTWQQSRKNMSQSWIPADILYNDRSRLAVWHPTDPNIAWGIGPGDIITKTVDGGKTFQWANNGYNGIMTGGLFNFNAQHPHILYFGSQDRFYIPDSNNRLQECDGPDYKPVDIADRLPRDEHGDGMAVSTIAVDPVEPNVIYAGANGTGLYYQHTNGVARSLDGGRSWERLTCNPEYCLNDVTGGQMASALRVNPLTRYLYVGTDCYGMWKIAPPDSLDPNKPNKKISLQR